MLAKSSQHGLMSLNINDITTVSDLINAQTGQGEYVESEKEDTPRVDELTELILDEEPAIGIELAIRILTALKDFHAKGIDMYIDEKKAEYSAQWASDFTKLEAAHTLIKDIQL